MHKTQEELAVQRAKALSRRVKEAHAAADKLTQQTKKPHRVEWSWTYARSLPIYLIEEVKS